MTLPTANIKLNAIDICHNGKCGGCTPQEDCRSAIVTTVESSFTAYIYTLVGDNPTDMVQHIPAAYTDDLLDVICRGGFIMAISAGANTGFPILRSYDGAVNILQLAGNTDMGSHAPAALDALDLNLIIFVGADGYIYITYNQGDNVETVDPGTATTENLSKVMICRQNPNVVYGAGANDAIVKSTDGGKHWFAVTATGSGNNITALWVVNQNELLVGTAGGEIYQSLDGGDTWTAQTLPATMPASATITAIRCCDCDIAFGCGACVIAVQDDGATDHKIYRNAGWASGQWEEVANGDALTHPVQDLACCDNNLVIGVGGDAAGTAGLIAILS